MTNRTLRLALLLAALLAAPATNAFAQTAKAPQSQEELSRTMDALDAALFDSYNRCDLEKFAGFFADDVEFYHDRGGLTLSLKSLVESVRNNICGKVRREVVAGSLEAHPVPNFGAVQMGSHRFYELSQGPNAGPVGSARFVSIWRLRDGAWKITRVISYDHGPARH